jgi:hypothetical protein
LRNSNEAQQDSDWVMQQAMAMRAMEQAAYSETMMREAMKKDHLEFLQRQIDEQRARQQAQAEQAKSNSIGVEFFESFGNDYR